MDSQVKAGLDGSQGAAQEAGPRPAAAYNLSLSLSSSRYSSSQASGPAQLAGYALRLAAAALTFIAAVVMGTARQAATVAVIDPSTLQSVKASAAVKYTYSSTLVYFIVINVLVLLYSAALAVVTYRSKTGSRGLELPFAMADLIVVVLLFSANGAAMAVSVVAETGHARLGWPRICGAVTKFCSHITAGIVMSTLASVAYLVLVVLAVVGIHRRAL